MEGAEEFCWPPVVALRGPLGFTIGKAEQCFETPEVPLKAGITNQNHIYIWSTSIWSQKDKAIPSIIYVSHYPAC